MSNVELEIPRERPDPGLLRSVAEQTEIPLEPVMLVLGSDALKSLESGQLLEGAAASAALSTRGLNFEALAPITAIQLCHLSLDCLEALSEKHFQQWFENRDAVSELAVYRDYLILGMRLGEKQDGGVKDRFYRLVRGRIGEQEARLVTSL